MVALNQACAMKLHAARFTLNHTREYTQCMAAEAGATRASLAHALDSGCVRTCSSHVNSWTDALTHPCNPEEMLISCKVHPCAIQDSQR
jgi:hypothetical protein